jgi:ankyrin repeat protein
MEKGNEGDAEQGRVVVKREKEKDERENEEEEERKKQKVEEEEKAQEQLNNKFLQACWKKTLADVKALVERGAEVFYCDTRWRNGLIRACQNEDYEAGEEIVAYLIKKHRGMTRMTSDEHWTALHFAARYSSAKICEILIENGCNVNARTDDLFTPLMLCCHRIDPEASEVTKLLIERGANLAKMSEKGGHALHFACLLGRDDVVQLLIDAKADVNVQTVKGRETPLMGAVHNRLFGEKIIPILMIAGADVSIKDDKSASAVRHAFQSGSGKMLKALAPFVPEGCTDLSGCVPAGNCPDPIGSMTEGLQFGCAPQWRDFIKMGGHSPSICWSMLRSSEFHDVSMIFVLLSRSNSFDLWCYSTTEMWQNGSARDFGSGETILHLAVKCKKLSSEDKIKIVQHIMSFQINPLVLDKNNKRAIEYCTKEEKELHHVLTNYQRWKPDKKVMDWYGPYCRRRLRAFLLVEKRLQLGFPRGLKNLILSYVAEMEYVWVPKKI